MHSKLLYVSDCDLRWLGVCLSDRRASLQANALSKKEQVKQNQEIEQSSPEKKSELN